MQVVCVSSFDALGGEDYFVKWLQALIVYTAVEVVPDTQLEEKQLHVF